MTDFKEQMIRKLDQAYVRNAMPEAGKLDRMRRDIRQALAASLNLAHNGGDIASVREAIEQATKARNVLIELEREMIRGHG